MTKSKKIETPIDNIVNPSNNTPAEQIPQPEKIEEIKPEVPKKIEPKPEKIESPKIETPKKEEPKVELIIETPKKEEPKVEPIIETPKKEEPKVEPQPEKIDKPKRKISEKSLANLRNSKIKKQNIESQKPEESKKLEKINNSLPGESTKPSKLLFYVGIALAVFVACIGGLFIYNWYKSRKSTKQNLVESANIEDLDQDTIANLKKIAEANRNFEESS